MEEESARLVKISQAWDISGNVSKEIGHQIAVLDDSPPVKPLHLKSSTFSSQISVR